MPHPAPPACLITPYSAKPHQKGGTLIAEDVDTLARHRQVLADPDAYRPGCGNCGRPRTRAHDFRFRKAKADGGAPEVAIRRYLCKPCGAVWQVLPAFIARHLHWRWSCVQADCAGCGCPVPADPAAGTQASVPRQTLCRWCSRLAASAASLTQTLAAAGGAAAAVIGQVSIQCGRAELVSAMNAGGLLQPGQCLAQLAGWIHRLVPGLRLM